MRSIAKVKSTIREYEIKSVKSLKDIISCALKPNTITFIDSNVAKIYRKLNHESFIIVDSTETIKTISGAEFIFDELLKRKANSKTHLVVIGGGILQDLMWIS